MLFISFFFIFVVFTNWIHSERDNSASAAGLFRRSESVTIWLPCESTGWSERRDGHAGAGTGGIEGGFNQIHVH